MTVNIVIVVIPSVTVFLSLGLIGYLVTHPHRADQLAGLFCRVARFLCWCFKSIRGRIEKHLVAAYVQATINAGVENLEQAVPRVLPYAVRIEYVKAKDVATFLRQGEIIVRLKQYPNQDQNIVNATLAYLCTGLLPRVRSHLEQSLRRGIDYATAKEILDISRQTGAANYFVTHVLEPALQQSEVLKATTGAISELQSTGYFSRIFLNELRELGDRITAALPDKQVGDEARKFLDFLVDIARRDEPGDLDFRGRRIAVSLLLVAEKGKIRRKGFRPYLRRIEQFVRAGTPGIYICGRGSENVAAVERLLREVSRQGILTVLRSPRYPFLGRRAQPTSALVAVCTTNVAYAMKRRRAAEPVEAALRKHVPQIAEDRWEIVRIERWVGYGAKVAVRLREELDVHGAVRQLFSSQQDLIKDIRNELGGETIHLVPWSPTPEEYIISALNPFRRSEILDVALDREELCSTVWVRSDEAKRGLIGKNGWNVKVAEDLVGWEIILETADARKLCEDEELKRLVEVLEREVPEIASERIRLEGLARLPGIGSKVVIRFSSKAAGKSAVRVCLGPENRRLKGILASLNREWVSFIEWNEDPHLLVASALYPLKTKDVRRVDIDERSREACVIVSNRDALEEAVGNDMVNLRLAQEASHWRIRVETPDGYSSMVKQADPQEELIALLKKHIPEIAVGKIALAKVAVEPGIGAKVAVTVVGEEALAKTPVEICLGKENRRLEAIRNEFGSGFVTFVNWGPDETENLVSALYPLLPAEVLDVTLHEASRTASLRIKTRVATAVAIGRGAGNLHLAEQLTGWNIHVTCAE